MVINRLPKNLQLMILKQKQGGKRKEFEIMNGTSLRIREKESGEMKEWTINLDSIGHNLVYQSATRKRLYIMSAFLSAFLVFITVALFLSDDFMGNLPVVIVSYLVFGLIIGLCFFSPLKKEIHLVGGVTITFFQDSPSSEEVDKFIGKIIRLSKKNLLHKYGRIDTDLPEETMMTQLNWLKNRDLLTEEEFRELKNEYKTQRLIGDQ
jgi:F0F1-type ATP synthase assembly protein I